MGLASILCDGLEGDTMVVKWTPERRKLQSRAISRRLKLQPWTPEQNEKRAQTLRGRLKTPESRAAMYASSKVGTERTEQWHELYEARLNELQRDVSWRSVRSVAMARNLKPEDVLFAIENTFGIIKSR